MPRLLIRLKQLLFSRPTRWVLAIFMAVLFSAVFVVGFGHGSYDVDGFRLGFWVNFSDAGKTELAIPPIGEITASTHESPLHLRVALERIYPNQISQVATEIDDSSQLVEKIEAEGKGALKQFIIRLLALAAVGGVLGAAIIPIRLRRQRAAGGAKSAAGAQNLDSGSGSSTNADSAFRSAWRVRATAFGAVLLKGVLGGLVGVAFIGMLLHATYQSYNIYAFKQPRYSGALTAAPWATDEVAKRLADIKAFRQEIKTVAKNMGRFYSKMDAWQPIQESTIKVLHVSDIHNNPVAIDLISRVVRDFKVDLVIDTGDITDIGTPVEARLIEGISKLGVPYVYVSGNHDSSQTVSFMRSVENVVLPGDLPVTVKGITIFGIFDPSDASFEMQPADDAKLAALGKEALVTLRALPSTRQPLVAAVHNPKVAGMLFGKVPIVLAGHTHKAELKEKGGFILNNAGTTGAAGIRSFQYEEGLPYTLSLLHIERGSKRLVAVDNLAMMGPAQEFRLERKLIRDTKELREANGAKALREIKGEPAPGDEIKQEAR